ncbi:MAG: protein phosphatase 2C domain-containing protein [Dysgonamonadaceae bacterium]|jgi:serine/threonine protein phosphatase PrpC|nr:protein phosphatase 2C domain-containing protein [Dysgonamonadaceae bacterium]
MNPVWDSWGCTVRGPAHQKQGIPNQDALRIRRYSWGNVIAVSDGLGSKRHADIGSQAACFAVTEAARSFATHHEALIERLPQLIHALWLIRIAPYKAHECGATCLFAIYLKERMILGRLGDGLITSLAAVGEESCIITDEKEESFSNMTRCLGETFRSDEWELRELSSERYTGIMLCTDGISDDLLPERRLYFSQQVFKNGKNITELRRTLVKWPVPGHTDDKTIACLVKVGVHT